MEVLRSFTRLWFVVLLLILSACSNGGGGNGGSNGGGTQSTGEQPEQWNITILLDLSHRIDPKRVTYQPSQKERDLQAVESIVEQFALKMKGQGVYKASSRIRVLFSPAPNNSQINSISESLAVRLDELDNRGKKVVHDSILSRYRSGLEQIYDLSIAQNTWIGSDVFSFFKNNVKDYCIEEGYRNILVLLTDGYLYHIDSKEKQGSRYSYISGEAYRALGFRSNDWRTKVENQDYGLICPRKDLQDLEVLVLEVNPSVPKDFDLIKYTLEKWFTEMQVKKFAIYASDLPSNTKPLIEKFLK